jgi:hypothetical protein
MQGPNKDGDKRAAATFSSRHVSGIHFHLNNNNILHPTSTTACRGFRPYRRFHQVFLVDQLVIRTVLCLRHPLASIGIAVLTRLSLVEMDIPTMLRIAHPPNTPIEKS